MNTTPIKVSARRLTRIKVCLAVTVFAEMLQWEGLLQTEGRGECFVSVGMRIFFLHVCA